jgi:hypothetical protein
LVRKLLILDEYEGFLSKKGPKMLPFLKNKQEGSTSGPVEVLEREPDEGSDSYDMLDAIVEDMLDAMASKDKTMMKSALEALCAHIADQDKVQDEQLTNKEV